MRLASGLMSADVVGDGVAMQAKRATPIESKNRCRDHVIVAQALSHRRDTKQTPQVLCIYVCFPAQLTVKHEMSMSMSMSNAHEETDTFQTWHYY